ncbi:hypothetical protein ADK57_06685 [Streptomyces sp. MMG1533]|uniref:DUF6247 family protein n=1 Tax=Streptomyces sp. MMG1533 TaxID=1415546 RepID=UPI0006AF12C8|nr:DUF6247 family protein [Streptomyces sp. MMG1533]KOU75137.1 hypothetical protein ADK57_06685 [Streptomyces sp. MMG1533]
MSAQPDHAPIPPYAPAPGAPAELLAQLRADRRAAQWVPAFEREWAAALEESRRTFSLAGLYEVVRDWQGRLAHAPAVDAFVASGSDPEGEDVRYASVGQLSLTYWVNRPLRRLTVLNIVWLG